MKELELVRNLITRAGHPSTTEEEARSSAVIAARLIAKHGFVIVTKETAELAKEESFAQPDDNFRPRSGYVPVSQRQKIDWDKIPPVKLFRKRHATTKGICNACGAMYDPGDKIAHEEGGGRITCLRAACLKTWITG